jgi:hypothetical protein
MFTGPEKRKEVVKMQTKEEKKTQINQRNFWVSPLFFSGKRTSVSTQILISLSLYYYSS